MFVIPALEEGFRVELQCDVHGALDCDASMFDTLCGEAQVRNYP